MGFVVAVAAAERGKVGLASISRILCRSVAATVACHFSTADLAASRPCLRRMRLLPGAIPPPKRESERAALPPVMSCIAWGLSCRLHCCWRGGLLPHLFTLTLVAQGGIFSVTLSVAEARAHNPRSLRPACCPMMSGLSSRPQPLKTRRATAPGQPAARVAGMGEAHNQYPHAQQVAPAPPPR